jgi:hypothetical protein
VLDEVLLVDVPPTPELLLLDVLDDAIAPPVLGLPPPLPPVPLGLLWLPLSQLAVDAASALDAKSTATRNPNL